jgi:hypothetical protein
MKGKMIWAHVPVRFGGGKICGFVKNVVRDILDGSIKIILTGGDEYVLREPGKISKTEDGIVFLYGNVKRIETDEDLFSELRRVGGDVNTAIKNMTDDVVSIVQFKVRDVDDKGKPVSKRKRRKGKSTAKRPRQVGKKSKDKSGKGSKGGLKRDNKSGRKLRKK